MSEKPARSKDRIKLDVETILHTTEGRSFLNQLRSVSEVLSIRDSEVEFKGEQLLKTGYIGDCKSVQLFKCPSGYFVFCNKAFTMNNWSAAAASQDAVIAKIYDNNIKEKLTRELAVVEGAS